jgi:membrane-bound lytic murein transglycosylase D
MEARYTCCSKLCGRMDVYHTSPSVKILLVTLLLLFWASCAADTTLLKVPENQPSESTITRESEGRPPRVLPEQGTFSQKEVEQARPSSSRDEEQKATQDTASPERGDQAPLVHSQRTEKRGNIAASHEAENTKEQWPAITSPQEKEVAGNAEGEGLTSLPTGSIALDKEGQIAPPAIEREKTDLEALQHEKETLILAAPDPIQERPVSSSTSSRLVEKAQQSTFSLHIDKEKIVPYPIKLEEEEEELALITLEPDTMVPAPTDVEEELMIITAPPIEEKQDVSRDSRFEKKSVGRGSPPPEETRVSPKAATIEQKESTSDAEPIGEEEVFSIPPEIEEPYEFVMLSQSDDEQPLRIPIWLEQGKRLPTPEQHDRGSQIAAIPKGKAPQTISSPEGDEEEECLPIEAESPMPSSPETQKQLEQEMLDSALEFCQASNDFWEQGDLYNAIAALDQAYSLILRISPEDDSELIQQKEDLRFTISKRIIEVYSSRFTAANGKNSVIPLVMNSHVERALNLFKGRERKFFLDSYRRSGKYRPQILSALKEAGLPEELSWLPLIESGFKVKAFSRSRALGLWQFVASTGYKFGLKRDRWVDERMDPEKSTQAAILYLKELHRIFGDWTTAMAAYNCGEGKVLKCIRTQRISYLDNFWDLYERLPRETAFYVPKFLAVLHILKNPEAHGFTLAPVDEEIETEAVTIDKQAHLKTISKYTGASYKLLKEINPSLRYSFTPDRPFSFKMPKGKGEVLLSKLNEIPVWHAPASAYVIHKVRRGDSLSVIARRYGTSVRSIMRLNGLTSSHFIRTGWRLKIPTRRNLPISGGGSSGVSGSTGRTELVRYVVQKGDSLWRIAERFGTTIKAIQSVNRLGDTRLSVGQILKVPQGLATTEDIKTKTYIVSKGDSPYLIAKRHRMKLSHFLRINDLSPRSTIFPGQALLVKAE